MVKVVIVEDDPMVMEINKTYIEMVEGFAVIGTSEEGHDAINLIKKTKPDLVILDIFMPGMSGLEVLKIIRRDFVRIDVIFVTAAKESDSIDEALNLGATDYLIKPFGYERFKQSLEKYKERYNLLKRKSVVAQEDIDRILDHGKEVQLEKGINIKTLENIRSYIKNMSGHDIYPKEIAKELDISKVTALRYLDYLASSGELKLVVEYGTVGRPTYVYHVI